jgi:hypothetical protein
MPDDVAARHVDPDAGIVIDWRAGNQQDFIAGVESGEVGGPLGEDGAVHGGPEARRPLRRERRWCAVIHMG